MLNLKKHGKILEPTLNSFETKAVLNPAIYQDGETVHLIYRAINDDGVSSLGYAKLNGPLTVAERLSTPFLAPQKKEESMGIEDPHIVKIDGEFYLTYVVHDGKHAITAFSSGSDLQNLRRQGVISPKIPYKDAARIFTYTKLKDEYYFFESFYKEHGGTNVYIWHKDVILFPEKINDQFVLLQRILPDIQSMYFDDFRQLKDKYYWINSLFRLGENVILEPEQGFELRHVGGGAVPIRTKDGWLLIYHAVEENNKRRVYHAGAALLDFETLRVTARLPYPLFSPTEEFELSGLVNNVVFPTGTALFGEDLYIYYGAGDRCIAAASVKLEELLLELGKNKR